MRLALRAAVLLLVFSGVAWLSARAVLARAAPSTPLSEVRLAAAMAGLFAGGACTVIVGIAMFWKRR